MEERNHAAVLYYRKEENPLSGKPV